MKRLSMLLLILVIAACNPIEIAMGDRSPTLTKSNQPKNIILMVGDGMGLTQITAGMYTNGNQLQLERCPIVGLHKSYSSDNLVTDSAAGATAFACGIKTYNGAIGVDPDTLSHRTILEEAEEQGMATGLVATSTIVHATPASFIAHQKSRKMYEAIAADFMNTEIDYFVGGGKKYFDRRETDDRNLYEELLAKQYVVTDYFKEDFKNIQLNPQSNFAYFTADGDPLRVVQGRDYLQAASIRGANFLDKRSREGFFLMIEGSQIDWGGHANKSDYIVSEMLDFDKAIGDILDFAEKDGETLVIITADHETGGYAIQYGSRMDSLSTAFTSDYHTAVMIPVFAYGPGAEQFSGIYENTAIYDKMRRALGFE
ncbi:MAG: alkaline phosphatase [Bacteroidota bacterium]